MSQLDDPLRTYETREIVAQFDDAGKFETCVEGLGDHRVRRDAIHMMASHDAVKSKLGHLFEARAAVSRDGALPQTIYEDTSDNARDKVLAVGVPVYIGGAGAGLAVVASGGTLAFAALFAAAGAAVGAGIGSMLARVIGKRHADFLQEQLALGALLVLVEVDGAEQEKTVTRLMEEAGGRDIHVHVVTGSSLFDQGPLGEFNPYGISGGLFWP